MQQVPLQSVPSQQVKTVLNGQNCQIAIYQKSANVFADVNVNGVDISSGILALNGVPTMSGFVKWQRPKMWNQPSGTRQMILPGRN